MGTELVRTEDGKRGPWFLTLVVMLAVVAMLATQSQIVSAAAGDLPADTTLVVNQTPAGSFSPAPGEEVSYVVTGTISAALTAGDSLTLVVVLDADFVVDSVICPGAAGVDGNGPIVGARWAPNVAAGNYACTIQGHNNGHGTISPPTALIYADTNDNLSQEAGEDGITATSSNAGTVFVGVELRHMPDGEGGQTAPGTNTNRVIARQEVNSNVRGSRHTICTVAQNTGVDGGDPDFLADDPVAIPVQIAGLTLDNILVTNGGGYADLTDTDPDFTDVRIFIGDGTELGSTVSSGLRDATCISWVSTDAGDQQVSLVYIGADGGSYSAGWDTDGDGNGGPVQANRALIKEWNRLEDSEISFDGVRQGSAQDITISQSVFLNPATGKYEFNTLFGGVSIEDVFQGSHTNSAGVNEGQVNLSGVSWTASVSSCASSGGALAGTSVLRVVGDVSAGFLNGNPELVVSAGDCLPGDSILVTFRGCEPGPLGSGEGVCVEQTVTINLVQNIAEKKVFLAWAGQRVILEHDWRVSIFGQLGDRDGGNASSVDSLGTCPFTAPPQAGLVAVEPTIQVTYVKGSGPGNFLPGQGVTADGSEAAHVQMSVLDDDQTDGEDIVGDMNGMCISRALFESEDQGQVDIEAFVDEDLPSQNATKVAFVIYYMKTNTVNVTLATQVSKPSHNSSSLADYSPGNPWNASLDDADHATEWNVSRDLLIRGRVTGWFLTTNPSGRAADTTNPLNILPADRWVMPQDWPLLAGGPGDPSDGGDAKGTAEQFRPYYDIMFAPNNGRLALAAPEGAALQVTTVVTLAGVSNTAGAFGVETCADLSLLVGLADLWIGSDQSVEFRSCEAGLLTVTGLDSMPAPGTPVLIVLNAPFEGPFSTLDIKGLAAQRLGGAALSDFDDNNVRDAAYGDGDVDMWDAPMPAAPVSVSIRGTGFIKQVLKSDVYYLGTANSTSQTYPNPYYIQDIPASPFIPAVVAGGGYHWNTWGNDGPGGNGQGVYRFWVPAVIGTNSEGIGDSFTTAQSNELAAIRAAYGDNTIARDLVVYSDNHGEFMVTANGDYRTDLTACSTNVLALGFHCAPGDHVGTGTITATVDYPDFRGKHFPVLSNAATVTWTWGGYKDVTVEDGETDQFKYIVFHAMDRDGFCSPLTSGAVLLHPVLSGHPNDTFNGGPAETIDFLIDSGEGIIVGGSVLGTINDGKQFATGVKTFSWALNNPATSGIKEFPLSSLAAAGAVDECQAWIRVSNSLLGILNVLVIAHNDEGNVGFDEIIDLQSTMSYTLNFRWSLITWAGADNISVNDAIKGTGATGANAGGNDISASVTAIYGWDAAAQSWLGFFPSGVNVPGANDLVTLRTGQAYWIAITGPSSVTWTIASDVN